MKFLEGAMPKHKQGKRDKRIWLICKVLKTAKTASSFQVQLANLIIRMAFTMAALYDSGYPDRMPISLLTPRVAVLQRHLRAGVLETIEYHLSAIQDESEASSPYPASCPTNPPQSIC